MKYRSLLIVCLLLNFSMAMAQTQEETYLVNEQLSADRKIEFSDTAAWDVGGLISINFSQVSLSNWSGGGQSSISTAGIFNLHANLKKKKFTWDNNLDLGYGFIKRKGEDLIKTDDKIDLTSKYGKYAFGNWYYSGLFNFRTQFDIGYGDDDSIKISDFLAPAYVLLAIGLDNKPNDNFSLFIAPVTAKFTYVNDQDLADGGAYGVEGAVFNAAGQKLEDGEKLRTELGGFLKMTYTKKDILKNVGLQTRLELFSNYSNNPQNIDVLWETIVDMKINEFLSANIITTLIYDDDIDIEVGSNEDGEAKFGPRTQFKEVFGLGLSYKF